jgi:glycosyltransferase involved in cell wall biosynthesis
MKRVLMLAYYFPPSKAAGTFRTLRFVRDLPACGWSPSVLTVRAGDYLQNELDPALVAKVPATTTVYRAAAPPFHRWYKRGVEAGKSLLRGNRHPAARPGDLSKGTVPAGSAPMSAAPPMKSAEARPSFRSPLDLAYMFCRTPDIDAGWYVPALLRGLWAVARTRPHVLYATGGPWTTFVVARDLARCTRLPLVLDYRDPWTLNPAVVRSGNVFEKLALGFERTVVRRAGGIVANTDVLRETLVRAHGEPIGRKTVVIHNSYDAADFTSPPPPQEDVFTLSYVGAMYDAHSPEPFLHAVARLAGERPDVRARLRVRLVGAGAARVAQRARELEIADVVVVQEAVPHAEAVRLQRAAHALLLFLTVPSDHSTFVPSKLFEYIAANRPILAVTRGGALDRLLRGREITPWIFAPEDIIGIAHGILNLFERYERGTLPRLRDEVVRGFSGEQAARSLATVLDAAAAGEAPPASATGAPLGAPAAVEEVVAP